MAPLSPSDLALLLSTIDRLDAETLRTTMRDLVRNSSEAAKQASERLLVGPAKARKPRWATCKNCEKDYDVTEIDDDDDEACRYHQTRSYASTTNRTFGPTGTKTATARSTPLRTVASTPEGDDANSEGCVTGAHVDREKTNKRKKN